MVWRPSTSRRWVGGEGLGILTPSWMPCDRACRRFWQWYVLCRFCCDVTLRAVFSSIVVRPEMLGIMAGMNQKDSHAAITAVACAMLVMLV